MGVTVGLDGDAGDDSSAAISVAICSDDWNSPKPVATALSRVCARADVSDEATLAGFSTRVPSSVTRTAVISDRIYADAAHQVSGAPVTFNQKLSKARCGAIPTASASCCRRDLAARLCA